MFCLCFFFVSLKVKDCFKTDVFFNVVHRIFGEAMLFRNALFKVFEPVVGFSKSVL